jgi:membrane fusion protein (multidrug efflux system)
MKTNKINQFLLLAGLAAILLLPSCQNGNAAEKEMEARFPVTSPVRLDTAIASQYVCQIHSIRNIEVRAMEKGYLQDIYVDEGQFVRKGQRMFKIMPMLYQAEFEKAQAEAKFAEIEYLNTKALADSNVVSENELALAKAKFDKAKAEMSLAAVHLGFTEITAPFDGIMDRLQVRQGSLVDEGDLLTTLSDNSEMWVYFNVPEAEYLDYKTKAKKGDMTKVKLRMANNEVFDFPGVVETIEAEFNNETGNIPFRATFPNPNGLLRHGETGSILMPVELKNALVIPQKVTFEILDKNYVYVVDDSGVIHAREITIEEELPHLYVIKEGLDVNEKVLLEGLRKVEEGEKITSEFKDPLTVISHLEAYSE